MATPNTPLRWDDGGETTTPRSALVVDGDAVRRLLLHAVLARMAYRPVLLDDGTSAARSLVLRREWSLVWIDGDALASCGLSVLRLCAKLLPRARTIVSARESDDVEARVRAAGCRVDAVVLRPLAEDKVARIVGRLLPERLSSADG